MDIFAIQGFAASKMKSVAQTHERLLRSNRGWRGGAKDSAEALHDERLKRRLARFRDTLGLRHDFLGKIKRGDHEPSLRL
jgi:hypothetical protein